jgi:hypothetical protein
MSSLLPAIALLGALAGFPQERQDELPDIVVEGRIPESLAREFIDEVAAPPGGATVARWRERVCIGTVNLQGDTAQYLIDRVAAVASDVGLEAEAPGCSPDVVVIATVNGREIARGLANRRRNALAPGNRIQSRSRGQLEAFAESVRPIRWWHISTAVDPSSGRSVIRDRRNENVNYTMTSELLENGPVSLGTIPSLIQSQFRQDLRRAVIIIDFNELGDDIGFDQLADYVAFVALAQVDPEGDTSGFSTILNLFDDPTTPGLTDWDRAYLQGLYNSDDSARSNSGREAALRREMLRAREDAQATSSD